MGSCSPTEDVRKTVIALFWCKPSLVHTKAKQEPLKFWPEDRLHHSLALHNLPGHCGTPCKQTWWWHMRISPPSSPGKSAPTLPLRSTHRVERHHIFSSPLGFSTWMSRDSRVVQKWPPAQCLGKWELPSTRMVNTNQEQSKQMLHVSMLPAEEESHHDIRIRYAATTSLLQRSTIGRCWW